MQQLLLLDEFIRVGHGWGSLQCQGQRQTRRYVVKEVVERIRQGMVLLQTEDYCCSMAKGIYTSTDDYTRKQDRD